VLEPAARSGWTRLRFQTLRRRLPHRIPEGIQVGLGKAVMHCARPAVRNGARISPRAPMSVIAAEIWWEAWARLGRHHPACPPGSARCSYCHQQLPDPRPLASGGKTSGSSARRRDYGFALPGTSKLHLSLAERAAQLSPFGYIPSSLLLEMDNLFQTTAEQAVGVDAVPHDPAPVIALLSIQMHALASIIAGHIRRLSDRRERFGHVDRSCTHGRSSRRGPHAALLSEAFVQRTVTFIGLVGRSRFTKAIDQQIKIGAVDEDTSDRFAGTP
jgi:hypothetical protein